jgi:hypothetical protein
MKEHSILPHDGHAVLIDHSAIDFDWRAITHALLETIPWRNEAARIFGRKRPVPRMTAWLGRSFSWIETNELKRRLDNGKEVTVIDVRGPDEFTGPRAISPLPS